MSKPKGVNKYRSGVRSPELEVHVFRDDNGQVVVHLVDYEQGKVTTMKKEKGEG